MPVNQDTGLSRGLRIGAAFTVGCVWALMVRGQNANPSCTVDVASPGARVADICRGQQIEEFNHQFQGGLYAQRINNPSFEELNNPLAEWSVVTSGSSRGTLSAPTSAETTLLNRHQTHCVKLEIASVASGPVGLANGGYWGMGLSNHTIYHVSFWARKGAHFEGALKARLEGNDGAVYAESTDFVPATDWRHFTCDLATTGISSVSGSNRFAIYASTPGDVYIDVVTVMPPTWKNRPNGLRPDLAQRLAELKFKYLQFPGGCTAESAAMDRCWNWKNSIGPLEARPGSTRNRWKYKNDLYFGLDEYLQLCEDLGAEPVYVTSAGMSEQAGDKDWFGICPLDQMQPIIDDILDLLEYANGPASTPWGAQRAANGHPAPYHLRFLEIGNENQMSGDVPAYRDRYAVIYHAVKARDPGIKIMYNGINNSRNPSQTFGQPVDFVDEHFYLKDLSSYYRQYERIDPACQRICVAEYASSIHGNGGDVFGNLGDALSDAVFMLGCEKNSERIWWTGYGNYAGFAGHGDFGPCLVWNDAVSSFTTPSYHMQKILFSDNQGTRILPFTQDTRHCYWSASLDTESGKRDVLLKAVNPSAMSETVNIVLRRAREVNPVGHFTVLTGAPEAENSLANPTKVTPATGTFAAGGRFEHPFPAHSISVLRIGITAVQ